MSGIAASRGPKIILMQLFVFVLFVCVLLFLLAYVFIVLRQS
jgi:hypothetical protein